MDLGLRNTSVKRSFCWTVYVALSKLYDALIVLYDEQCYLCNPNMTKVHRILPSLDCMQQDNALL